MLLTDKVVLITGSVRGTGAGVSRVFAKEGARVVINQVKDESDPSSLPASCKRDPDGIKFFF